MTTDPRADENWSHLLTSSPDVPRTILLTSILRVTGIPPTESHALRSKGEAYCDYQRRVSKFIPLPPKTGT